MGTRMRALPPLRKYGLAIAISGTGLLVSWLSGEPVLLLAATSLVFFYGGRGPGLLSVGICGIGAGFLLPGVGSTAAVEPNAYIRSGLLIATASAIGFLVQEWRGQDAPDRVEDKANKIVESMPGLAWTADAQGRLTSMN